MDDDKKRRFHQSLYTIKTNKKTHTKLSITRRVTMVKQKKRKHRYQ